MKKRSIAQARDEILNDFKGCFGEDMKAWIHVLKFLAYKGSLVSEYQRAVQRLLAEFHEEISL